MAARRLLRDSVLGAVMQLLPQRPWSEITMAEVAAAAGVSRQTLYNEFRSREGLSQAFVIREAERFIADVEAAIALHLDDPSAALEEALEVVLTAASEHALVGMLLKDDGTEGMLPLLTTRSGPVLAWATARLASAIAQGWPQIHPQDCRLLAEALVRLAISYIIAPTVTPERAAADAVRLLGPFLARVLEQPADATGRTAPPRPAAG